MIRQKKFSLAAEMALTTPPKKYVYEKIRERIVAINFLSEASVVREIGT
jgi:hypothetical protein